MDVKREKDDLISKQRDALYGIVTCYDTTAELLELVKTIENGDQKLLQFRANEPLFQLLASADVAGVINRCIARLKNNIPLTIMEIKMLIDINDSVLKQTELLVA